MKSLLGKRWLWLLLGLILLSVIIWIGGPYLSFADYPPLASALARCVLIAVIFAIWGARVLWRSLVAARAANQLVGQMARQEDPSAARASADARQMQQRFEEAVAALRSSRKGRTSLYDLPWYIIIGPPGAGKTTAIVNSGLNFPLAQKFGKEALRGVGGTRNCDWWFTDQAILLDTAGRYTTQDSDQASDAAGWKEFLGLLRRFRKRRPINGVLVAMSVADLATQSDAERARHVAAVRQRLDELHRELRIELPVYLLLTKADLLAGFNEFFDDLPQQGRAQVLGTTFALERSRAGTAAQQLAPELDGLLERLDARMLSRLQSERDVQRRGLVFGFPRQLAGIRRALESFVGETFGAGGLEGGFWLRGVYFTSGTQEGTPIDRMLGALARSFGLGVRAVAAPPADRGKAFFIQRLLNDVVFRESGLAGVNRLAEVRQALVQAGAYIGALAVALLLLIALIVSYGRNHSYLTDVAAAVQPLSSLPAAVPASAAADLPRLDAYRAAELAASRGGKGAPLSMRFGLNQSDAIYGAAHDAYLRELNAALAPALAAAFHDRIGQLAGDPAKLYEYLKAYLMLGSPERLVPAEMQFMGDHLWRSQGGQDESTLERLDQHLAALLADPDRIQPVALDGQLIEQARNSLRQASLPVLMYSRLELSYAGDTRDAIHLDQQIGLGGTSAFVRRSGTPLSVPVPALYTRKVFDQVATTGKYEVAKDFIGESWVLGPGVASAADLPKLADGMMQLYESDYIRYWDSLLADIEPRSATSPQQLADMMALLSGPTSPLKRLLVIAADNTNLLKPTSQGAKAASVKAAIATKLAALEQTFGATPAAQRPGTRVTQHFAALQALVAGPPGGAPIDQTLRAIAQIQQQLAGIGGGLGDTNALSAVASQAQASALAQLRVAALQLPPPVSGIVAQIGNKGAAVAKAQAGEELARRYRTDVTSQCRELISGRYPFAPGSQSDVAIADFARLFGPGGVFDTFFQQQLSPLVDTASRPWHWRQGAGGIGSSSLLREFEAVDRIRQVFFPPGSQLPTARFTATPQYLDASVQRLEVDIDGQKLEYRHGPPVPQPLIWPGPAPGQASVIFEESDGGGPHRAYQGPWALFRLLDTATVKQETPLKYLVTLQAGGRTASLLLEASSAINPFGQSLLRGFRCGG